MVADRVLSVSELNRSVRLLLEQSLPLAWISGEISNLTIAASGHWYFSLKDKTAQVRCVMFRGRTAALDFRPSEGLQVEIRATPGLYEPRGEFQLNVDFMRKAGLGALFEQFERLKAKLNKPRDVAALSYGERFRLLVEELDPGLSEPVRVLTIAEGTKAKRRLCDTLRAAKAGGLVFKQRDAPYKAGRPASGGTQRKHKFVKSADVVLLSNAGNAYQMAVYDGAKLVEVGKVFAGTTNASRKQLDALLSAGTQPVAEVKYLYATDDEQLFQPVFVRIRTDKAAKACLRSQLVKTNRAVAPSF